jgi:hypothetical protein
MSRVDFLGQSLSRLRLVAATRGLTDRWSGRVKDEVLSSDAGVRVAQLNR